MDISENHSIHGSECQLEARYSFNLCLLQTLRKFRNSEIKSLCYFAHPARMTIPSKFVPTVQKNAQQKPF